MDVTDLLDQEIGRDATYTFSNTFRQTRGPEQMS